MRPLIPPLSKGFARLAEVGHTRQGLAFAAEDGHAERIVTGGPGMIAVKHGGKTNHVCRKGCKALREDDPEAVLAEIPRRRESGKDQP